MLAKIKGAIKNEQHRDTRSTGTRHRAETNNTGHKTQGADKQHWAQDTGRRQITQGADK
jgi:hypothetical protein